MKIRLSVDGGTWTTAYKLSGATLALFDIPLAGKEAEYLRIVAPTRTWMHLDEVEVFATDDPKKNIALGRPALQSSISTWSSQSIVVPPIDEETMLKDTARAIQIIGRIVERCGRPGVTLVDSANELHVAAVGLDDPRWGDLYDRSTRLRDAWNRAGDSVRRINFRAIRMAIEDLSRTFPDRYTKGEEYLARLAEFEERFPEIVEGLGRQDSDSPADIEAIERLRREALLANPLLDFDQLVVLRRKLGAAARSAMGGRLGVGTLNSHTNDSLAPTGWDNELAGLANLRGGAELTTLYKTPSPRCSPAAACSISGGNTKNCRTPTRACSST